MDRSQASGEEKSRFQFLARSAAMLFVCSMRKRSMPATIWAERSPVMVSGWVPGRLVICPNSEQAQASATKQRKRACMGPFKAHNEKAQSRNFYFMLSWAHL